MDGTNPKVSFIPKGSLVREESFLERRRPRSAIGFIAISLFILSIATYAGLYFYNRSLSKIVAAKTIEIKAAQEEISNIPEVNEARVFRARADLARELLNAHKVASPVFAFLSKNTTESILFDKFSFKNTTEGLVLELSGEAPTYAALAYQTDVLRSQTKEISNFSVRNVVLTKLGTITFVLELEFNPVYLLYMNNLNSLNTATSTTITSGSNANNLNNSTSMKPASATSTPVIVPSAPEANVSTTSATTTKSIEDYSVPSPATDGVVVEPTTNSGAPIIDNNWTVAPGDTATTSAVVKNTEEQSFLKALWSKFKFW